MGDTVSSIVLHVLRFLRFRINFRRKRLEGKSDDMPGKQLPSITTISSVRRWWNERRRKSQLFLAPRARYNAELLNERGAACGVAPQPCVFAGPGGFRNVCAAAPPIECL